MQQKTESQLYHEFVTVTNQMSEKGMLMPTYELWIGKITRGVHYRVFTKASGKGRP